MATKTYYIKREEDEATQTGSTAEYKPIKSPDLIKVYETAEDADTAIASTLINENEIIATKELDYIGCLVTDKIEEGNMNPVTSNAVATSASNWLKSYIKNQIKLSEFETISIGSSVSTAATMEYDGILYAQAYYPGGSSNDTFLLVYINGNPYRQGVGTTSYYTAYATLTLPVHKGDVVYYGAMSGKSFTFKVAYYKDRDYSI